MEFNLDSLIIRKADISDAKNIIDYVNKIGGERTRIKHTGEFGVSVLKEYWGNGIGR